MLSLLQITPLRRVSGVTLGVLRINNSSTSRYTPFFNRKLYTYSDAADGSTKGSNISVCATSFKFLSFRFFGNAVGEEDKILTWRGKTFMYLTGSAIWLNRQDNHLSISIQKENGALYILFTSSRTLWPSRTGLRGVFLTRDVSWDSATGTQHQLNSLFSTVSQQRLYLYLFCHFDSDGKPLVLYAHEPPVLVMEKH